MRIGGGCPTCGAPLDSEREAIHQASRSTTALLAAGIVLFLLSAAGKPVGNWEAGVLFVLSLCVMVTWCVIRTHRRRAVLWEDGFVLIGRSDEPEVFRWEDIATIKWNAEGDRLACVDGEGKSVTTIMAVFFGTHDRAERFLEQGLYWRRKV